MRDFISIKNTNGLELLITPIGASVASFFVPDKYGQLKDIVLGFDKPEMYLTNKKYYGAAIGRYSNLINYGRFNLNNKQIQLSINYGNSHLHGGWNSFSSANWKVFSSEENSIVFKQIFPDGQDGYPGNLEVKIQYKITDENKFIIKWNAFSDKDTIASFTNHSYFNLNGHDNLSIEDHYVKLNCKYYLPINSEFIPTAEIKSVKGSLFDFRNWKEVTSGIYKKEMQLVIAGGYDHNFVTPGKLEEVTAEVYAERSGILMLVNTTLPGIQFYTDNDKTPIDGKNGITYKGHGAICFETQYFPDAPNHANFPSPVLQEGKEYCHLSEYSFSII